MLVAEAVGRALAALGVDAVFGLVGSGNLTVSNALRDAGARFVAARHEGGAVCMADGYARVSGRLPAVSVHQGPGLTNAITGLTEAAKSRTPMVVLAGDTPAAALRSNFRIDQAGLVEAVGAVAERVHGPATALRDTARAVRRAREERRAVVLMLPLDVQAAECGDDLPAAAPALAPPAPAEAVVAEVAALLAAAERPAIVAGRGAVLAGAGPALRRLGERCGAVVATSAVANGLFAGDPYDLGIAGALSSPLATRLLREADLVLAFGAALNAWTTAHGKLIGPDARVVQVDVEPEAIAAHRPVDAGVIGDARATAEALIAALPSRRERSAALAEDIRDYRWRNEPYEESRASGAIDPRTLTIALDASLPDERTVVVDPGRCTGWPAMYLRVPDPAGFVFPQAFASPGVGLGNAIGAAIARPDRVTVAAVGDGGMLMALPELETLGRLGLPMLVVIYDDAPQPTDFEAIAKGAGCHGLTVRRPEELEATGRWLQRRDGPLVIDAKVDPEIRAAYAATWP